MPDKTDKDSESPSHRQHDHSERGDDTAHEQSQAQAQAIPDYEIGGADLMMGDNPSGITASDGGVSLQRSHARMLSEVGLGRSINAQRRINLYLQLQRTYGNSHVQQVNRLMREHQPSSSIAEQTQAVDTATAQDVQRNAETSWEVRSQGTNGKGTPLQRVPIRDAPTPETLLEKQDPPATTPATPGVTPTPPVTPPPPPAYVANAYTGHGAYDMTRQADSVRVNVRILFLSPPTDTDASGNILPDNDPLRKGGEIPSGDARRTEALNLTLGNTGTTGSSGTGSKGGITTVWNNKVELVGRQKMPVGAGAGSRSDAAPATTGPDIVLPIKFAATAVFTESQAHDQRVFLHAATDVADPNRADPSRNLRSTTPATPPPAGTPARKPGMSVIDAGNWYTARPIGNYGFNKAGDPNNFPLDTIYAHEYGHYLGIPDEYSRSNPAMHTIMHGVTPNQAERDKMDKEINAASSEEIILAAMMPQLKSHMNTISQAVLQAVQDQKKMIIRKLTASLRAGWHNKAVLDSVLGQVNSHLDAVAAVPATPASGTTPASPGSAALPEQTKAKKAARQTVIFEATKNLSYLTKAQDAVEGLISSGSTHGWITGILSDALEKAVGKASNNHVHQIGAGVQGLPTTGLGMRVDTLGIPGTSANLDTSATNASRTLVGASPPGTTPPSVHPSGSLLSQISKLPESWRTMANLFDDSAVEQSIQTLAAGDLEKGNFRGGVNDNVRNLYKQLYARFNAVTQDASYGAIARLLKGQVQPLMEGQLQELMTAIKAEAASHGTATPTGTTGSGASAPDPAVAARAAAIKTAVTTMSTEAKTIQDTPETTANADGTTTKNPLHVRMTMNSTMGSQYNSTDVRPNYMESIIKNFNAKRDPATLKHEDETDFTVRRLAPTPGSAGGGT